MKRSFYQDRDYDFGQIMLTLRSGIGITQAALAEFLGVSRRAVGDWESGSSYPKPEHLKKFVELGLQHQVFAAGQEADEIRALWRSARQKILFDETWLAALLPALARTSAGARDTRAGAAILPLEPGEPRVDWGDALLVPVFYGRERELNLLRDWVVTDRCRVVSVLGLGGIGKSALAVRLMRQVAADFEIVIWRSVRDSPDCEAFIDGCLQVLEQPTADNLSGLDRRLRLLLDQLRQHRVLLVLDNVETLLEEGDSAGWMRAGYEGYGRLLRQIADTSHQSCMVLTSREKPSDLALHEGLHLPVRVLRLARLDVASCEQLLAAMDVIGTEAERVHLIDAYAGNPLALKIVTQTIIELFGGSLSPFLEQGEVIFGSVRDLLREQFDRLSALEQHVLLWLAIMREPVTIDGLLTVMVAPVQRGRLLEALEALHRRSLIERGQQPGSFTLQSVVLEYVTTRLLAEAEDELLGGQFVRLVEHGLELAHAHEYIRQTQERLLVTPLLMRLRQESQKYSDAEGWLRTLLRQIAGQSRDKHGYAPANLVALLRALRGDLRGVDLSGLVLRGVTFQGTDMQDASLAGSLIQSSVFTETFDAITAVAISPTGTYWAAASRRGEVLMWVDGGLHLQNMWRAHADMIWTLAFSPDGRLLATGSWDGALRVWDTASGALLWAGGHKSHVNSVAFSPDGMLLASAGNDSTVRLWELRSGVQLQEMVQSAPIPVIAWNYASTLLASGDSEGWIRLWRIDANTPPVLIASHEAHALWVDGLAFAPDDRLLASGSWDSTVRLWDGAGAGLLRTLAGHTDRVTRLAWSVDGQKIASVGRDRSVRIWDVAHDSPVTVLRGHNAGINGLAFTPDRRSILSGSEDGTLRIWDVLTGHCTRVVQGYGTSLYDVAWSPDGRQLVSSGTDYLVTTYALDGSVMPKLLRGHIGVVFGVSWRPDGQVIASSEWDNTIILWNAVTGSRIKSLSHPDDPGNYFYGLAWSPDGMRLASGTYRRGVHVFDFANPDRHWGGQEFPTWIRHVVWSPDGARLAGGGDDGAVYIWDAADGTLIRHLTGHQSTVTRLAWSDDGTLLASGGSGGDGGELFVWDIRTGTRVFAAPGRFASVYGVAWGFADQVLISGDSDGLLRWWDIQSGENLLIREAHRGTIQSIRRSPDGTKLASCGDDGAIVLVDLKSGDSLQTIRRDRPYERLDISGIRGLTDAQKMALRELGTVEYLPD